MALKLEDYYLYIRDNFDVWRDKINRMSKNYISEIENAVNTANQVNDLSSDLYGSYAQLDENNIPFKIVPFTYNKLAEQKKTNTTEITLPNGFKIEDIIADNKNLDFGTFIGNINGFEGTSFAGDLLKIAEKLGYCVIDENNRIIKNAADIETNKNNLEILNKLLFTDISDNDFDNISYDDSNDKTIGILGKIKKLIFNNNDAYNLFLKDLISVEDGKAYTYDDIIVHDSLEDTTPNTILGEMKKIITSNTNNINIINSNVTKNTEDIKKLNDLNIAQKFQDLEQEDTNIKSTINAHNIDFQSLVRSLYFTNSTVESEIDDLNKLLIDNKFAKTNEFTGEISYDYSKLSYTNIIDPRYNDLFSNGLVFNLIKTIKSETKGLSFDDFSQNFFDFNPLENNIIISDSFINEMYNKSVNVDITTGLTLDRSKDNLIRINYNNKAGLFVDSNNKLCVNVTGYLKFNNAGAIEFNFDQFKTDTNLDYVLLKSNIKSDSSAEYGLKLSNDVLQVDPDYIKSISGVSGFVKYSDFKYNDSPFIIEESTHRIKFVQQYELPEATKDILGGIKLGDDFRLDPNGRLLINNNKLDEYLSSCVNLSKYITFTNGTLDVDFEDILTGLNLDGTLSNYVKLDNLGTGFNIDEHNIITVDPAVIDVTGFVSMEQLIGKPVISESTTEKDENGNPLNEVKYEGGLAGFYLNGENKILSINPEEFTQNYVQIDGNSIVFTESGLSMSCYYDDGDGITIEEIPEVEGHKSINIDFPAFFGTAANVQEKEGAESTIGLGLQATRIEFDSGEKDNEGNPVMDAYYRLDVKKGANLSFDSNNALTLTAANVLGALGNTAVPNATNASQLGGVAASSYATKSYVDDAVSSGSMIYIFVTTGGTLMNKSNSIKITRKEGSTILEAEIPDGRWVGIRDYAGSRGMTSIQYIDTATASKGKMIYIEDPNTNSSGEPEFWNYILFKV